ncbi:MAG TPA: nucleotidyltransferase domain-containing protein [Deinococcales bacterium]|nr:nucleotidyltransferase domain-containing protein [Deinococcales bacterium]
MARAVAAELAEIPEVLAVAMGGSRASGTADAGSDIDLYVFSAAGVPVEPRAALARARSAAPEIDAQWWGPTDEWRDDASGIWFDLTFWTQAWMQAEIEKTLVRFEPNLGYSTSFWHTLLACVPLHDPSGWLAALKDRFAVPYPEELRRNVVAFNRPLLRAARPAYLHQAEKAVGRNDLVSLNHRLAGFFASYFDCLYALNRVPNPGEKRLLDLAERDCPQRPATMRADVEGVLKLAATPSRELLEAWERAARNLEDVLEAEGL